MCSVHSLFLCALSSTLSLIAEISLLMKHKTITAAQVQPRSVYWRRDFQPKQTASIFPASMWSNPTKAVFFTSSSELYLPPRESLNRKVCCKKYYLQMEQILKEKQQMAITKLYQPRSCMQYSLQTSELFDIFCRRVHCFVMMLLHTSVSAFWYQSRKYIKPTEESNES